MRGDRIVAGLWCHEVLAKLSDYLDAELSPEEKAKIEAHVQQCNVCAQFGGRFAATIQQLKHQATPLNEEVSRRLSQQLQETK